MLLANPKWTNTSEILQFFLVLHTRSNPEFKIFRAPPLVLRHPPRSVIWVFSLCLCFLSTSSTLRLSQTLSKVSKLVLLNVVMQQKLLHYVRREASFLPLVTGWSVRTELSPMTCLIGQMFADMFYAEIALDSHVDLSLQLIRFHLLVIVSWRHEYFWWVFILYICT